MGILLGSKILEEIDSPINGRIKVVRGLGLGTYIQVENLTQSGGVVNGVWKKALAEVGRLKPDRIKEGLVLGLGGGSAAMLIKDLWPEVKVTGVDIDPLMVDLGKKYLGLEGINVVIEDAKDFIVKSSRKYELILVDTYLGDSFPQELEKDDFLIRIKRLLSPGGVAVFNRLYYGEKRPQAMKFAVKLEAVFPNVKYVFPEANLMLLCYN